MAMAETPAEPAKASVPAVPLVTPLPMPVPEPGPAYAWDRQKWELGLSLGFPTGLSFQTGLWNIGGTGLLARVSVGTFLLGLTAEGEFGYCFNRDGAVKHFVTAAGGGVLSVLDLRSLGTFIHEGGYVGPRYGVLLWDHLTITAGPMIYFGNTSFGTTIGGSNLNILPYGKIGFSTLF